MTFTKIIKATQNLLFMIGDILDNGDYSWTPSFTYDSPKEVKIIPAKFIPQYQAKTPEEQGKLEENFLTFVKYVSLKAEQDYKVKVSKEEGTIYLRPIDAFSHIKNGKISVSSRGADVTSIDDIIRKTNYGCTELSHTKEVIIDGQRFILANYSRLSA